jgi:cell wall-associated NlpC family hydrolase
MSDGLLPSLAAAGVARVDRELPKEARDWGNIIDLTQLEAGDLLLFRPVDPNSDSISVGIKRVQSAGGLPERHAQWTHAAVYLGDDEHVCEANFKVPGQPNGVNIRSAFAYCDGLHAVRARRPKNMTQKQRLRIAIGAMSNLGKSYSFRQITDFATAAVAERGFKKLWRGVRNPPQAFVCSTLYQDAYNFAFQGTSIRLGSLCTPAHLSASEDFEATDPALQWLAIE